LPACHFHVCLLQRWEQHNKEQQQQQQQHRPGTLITRHEQQEAAAAAALAKWGAVGRSARWALTASCGTDYASRTKCSAMSVLHYGLLIV
jgi:hypothetical protein